MTSSLLSRVRAGIIAVALAFGVVTLAYDPAELAAQTEEPRCFIVRCKGNICEVTEVQCPPVDNEPAPGA